MKSTFKLISFLFLFISFSCSSDDETTPTITEEPTSRNKIDLKINGLPPVNGIKDLTATFCCNDKITVSFDHWISTPNGLGYGGTAFSLSLDKNGNLIGLWYKDYTHPNNEFESAYFIPVSTLTIENFQFVENQLLKFKISGQIFKRTYNFFTAPETVNIDANIEIKDFITCTCSFFISKLTTNNSFKFHQITKTEQGTNIRYEANTNNGYQIEFKNFNQYLSNMPIGTYTFNENSTTHRIDFRKFIGVPRAFYMTIIPQEWLQYETSGSFEIFERYQVNGQTVAKVRFNLVAKENGVIVHVFNNGVFKTAM